MGSLGPSGLEPLFGGPPPLNPTSTPPPPPRTPHVKAPIPGHPPHPRSCRVTSHSHPLTVHPFKSAPSKRLKGDPTRQALARRQSPTPRADRPPKQSAVPPHPVLLKMESSASGQAASPRDPFPRAPRAVSPQRAAEDEAAGSLPRAEGQHCGAPAMRGSSRLGGRAHIQAPLRFCCMGPRPKLQSRRHRLADRGVGVGLPPISSRQLAS